MFLKDIEYTRSLTTDEILANMREIAENDMIQHVGYYSPDISRNDLAESGAICGGHQACAVGSLYLAASIIPHQDGWYDDDDVYYPPNVNVNMRWDFMKDNELNSLTKAYTALNSAAMEYINNTNLHDAVQWSVWAGSGAMETLFESVDSRIESDNYGSRLVEQEQLLSIIDRARTIAGDN